MPEYRDLNLPDFGPSSRYAAFKEFNQISWAPWMNAPPLDLVLNAYHLFQLDEEFSSGVLEGSIQMLKQ